LTVAIRRRSTAVEVQRFPKQKEKRCFVDEIRDAGGGSCCATRHGESGEGGGGELFESGPACGQKSKQDKTHKKKTRQNRNRQMNFNEATALSEH